MFCRSRAGWSALLVVAALANGVRADEPPSVHSAVTTAVADGQVVKTKQLGFSIARDTFGETNSRGGILIGFDLGIRERFDKEIITAIRPIYRTASGDEANGQSHGSFTVERDGIKRVAKLRARPGYAVGAVRLRTGLGIDALALTYARVSGDRLDAGWTYKSEWIGNVKGGSEGTLDGDGMPIVGVFGNRDRDRVIALGLVRVSLPAQVVPKKEAPPVVKLKPVEQPAEKPAAPQAAWAFCHEAFTVELPPGWAAAKANERPTLKQVGVIVAEPQAAFRDPAGTAFVFLRTRPLRGEGRTLDEIGGELTPSAGPYRETSQLTDVKAGEVAVDRVRRRFAWRTTEEVSIGGRLEVLHVCHVGTDSAVTLECLAHPEAVDAAQPTFERVIDKAKLDANKIHREPPASSPTWLPIAVFLGVSAVVFVPCAAYFGLRKKTPHPPRKKTPREIPYAELAPDEEGQPAVAFAPSTGIVSDLPAAPSTPLPAAPPAARQRHDQPADDPFTCVGERRYRVYMLPDEVYFIDDGPGEVDLSGKLLAPAWREERPGGPEHRPAFGERPTADDLFALVDGETNFRVKTQDVWQAVIEVPGFWDSLGADVVGTLRFGHRTRGELTFRFRGASDMRRAIEQLRTTWPHCLAVQATWDAKKKKFVREA